MAKMGMEMVATTDAIAGREVRRCHGIVCGQSFVGENVVADVLNAIGETLGGNKILTKNKLSDARDDAIAALMDEADKLGANAIVGVRLDHEAVRGTMLLVTATGTAVELS